MQRVRSNVATEIPFSIPLPDESPASESITEEAVVASFGLRDAEIERRKRLVGIQLEDQQRIATVRKVVESHAAELTDEFFDHLGREDARVPRYSELVAMARPLKHKHLIAMVRGPYDLGYARQRLRLGLVYSSFGLETSVFLGAYHDLLAGIQRTLMRESRLSAPAALEAFLSLRRVAFFDLSLQIDVLIHSREQLIREQAQAIRELSTPVLQLRDRLLLMPLIGVIDHLRVRLIADRMLWAIHRTRALVVVLDITGVGAMDNGAANDLSQVVSAAQLMGAQLIITGVSAQSTQAMQWLQLGSHRIWTAVDLQAGFDQAERLLVVNGAMPPAAIAPPPRGQL
jgi:rsbT co-antagonist protein RsbR